MDSVANDGYPGCHLQVTSQTLSQETYIKTNMRGPCAWEERRGGAKAKVEDGGLWVVIPLAYSVVTGGQILKTTTPKCYTAGGGEKNSPRQAKFQPSRGGGGHVSRLKKKKSTQR